MMQREIYPLKYEGLLFFQFDEKENIFYDDCGMRVTNIMEFITPNNLFLFQQDYGRCAFYCRDDPHILCVLLRDGMDDELERYV